MLTFFYINLPSEIMYRIIIPCFFNRTFLLSPLANEAFMGKILFVRITKFIIFIKSEQQPDIIELSSGKHGPGASKN